jgi:hypothetical protein
MQDASPSRDAAPPPSGLLRVLGVAFGVTIIVGNTIAAGILRTPGDVAARLPSPAGSSASGSLEVSTPCAAP